MYTHLSSIVEDTEVRADKENVLRLEVSVS